MTRSLRTDIFSSTTGGHVTHDRSEVLPKGWYYSYVSDELGYCPTRVWGLDELPADEAMANLYAQGNRWVVVFSDATGPRGDRTFIHIDSFDADAMMANRLKEVDALQEVASDLIPRSQRDASGRASPTVDQVEPGRRRDAPAHEITSPALSNQGAGPMKPAVGARSGS